MDRTIRVLHLLPYLGGGGVERRRLELARKLDPSRFKQRIICMEAEPPISEAFEKTGVPFEATGGRWSIGDIPSILEISRAIANWGPDIVHGAVFEGVTMASVAGRIGGASRIVVEEIDYPIYRSWKGNLLFGALAHASTRCVGVSPSVMEYLDDVVHVPESKRIEILNGISRREPKSEAAIENARAAFDIPRDAFVIGTVGRLSNSHKRITDLLTAYERLREEISNLYVLIVGSGDDETELKEWTANRGLDDRVIFTGYRDDVGTMLNLMDVFVLASNRESFGLVLVEAMYEGLPVVATRVGGPKRIVVEGETGLFVPPFQPDAIARSIRYLYRNPDLRKKMGRAGRRRAEKEFSAERYVRDVENFYLELMRRTSV